VVGFPSKGEVRALPLDTTVSFVPMEAVGEYGGLILDQVRPIEEVLSGYTYFRDGDVIVAKITPCFENGKGALAQGLENGVGFGTTELHVLRAGAEILPLFLFFLTLGEHFRKLGTAEMYGAGGQKRVPESFLQNLRHPLPPLDEQRGIAAFLDRETARIDALIAKKRRLIELLKEKRQAVISRAVTKGLDPTAPTKPSGIAWLGGIPAHWQAKRLRFSMRSIEQGWSPQCENRQAEVDEWGVLKVGCVNGEQFDPSENKALPPELKPLPEYEIKAGDLLMSRANTRELLGSATLVGEVRPKLLLCDKLYRIRIQEGEVLPRFLLLFFESTAGRFQFERDADGTSGSMKNIGQDTIKNTVVPLPPLSEQQRIVAAITIQQSQVSNLRDAIEAAITKLRDHRTSLIAAAVTGQIDVRQYGKKAT
jgi:type I restriction enzyme S subunit